MEELLKRFRAIHCQGHRGKPFEQVTKEQQYVRLYTDTEQASCNSKTNSISFNII